MKKKISLIILAILIVATISFAAELEVIDGGNVVITEKGTPAYVQMKSVGPLWLYQLQKFVFAQKTIITPLTYTGQKSAVVIEVYPIDKTALSQLSTQSFVVELLQCSGKTFSTSCQKVNSLTMTDSQKQAFLNGNVYASTIWITMPSTAGDYTYGEKLVIGGTSSPSSYYYTLPSSTQVISQSTLSAQDKTALESTLLKDVNVNYNYQDTNNVPIPTVLWGDTVYISGGVDNLNDASKQELGIATTTQTNEVTNQSTTSCEQKTIEWGCSADQANKLKAEQELSDGVCKWIASDEKVACQSGTKCYYKKELVDKGDYTPFCLTDTESQENNIVNPKTTTTQLPKVTSNLNLIFIIGAVIITGIILYFGLRKTKRRK